MPHILFVWWKHRIYSQQFLSVCTYICIAIIHSHCGVQEFSYSSYLTEFLSFANSWWFYIILLFQTCSLLLLFLFWYLVSLFLSSITVCTEITSVLEIVYRQVYLLKTNFTQLIFLIYSFQCVLVAYSLTGIVTKDHL